MNDWNMLMLDNGDIGRIKDFVGTVWDDPFTVRKFESKLRESKKKNVEKGFEATENIPGKVLTLYGDGCYHHYTYGLVDSFVKQGGEKFGFGKRDYMYVHMDFHTDMWGLSWETTDCACFVHKLPKRPDILLIGTDVGPHKKKRRAKMISQADIASSGMEKLLRKNLQRSSKQKIYLSMDLDIMDTCDMLSSYNQGTVKLENMFDMIDIIQEEKEIMGADILGYSKARHMQDKDLSSLITYTALAAKIAGKDTSHLMRVKKNYRGDKEIPVAEYRYIRDNVTI